MSTLCRAFNHSGSRSLCRAGFAAPVSDVSSIMDDHRLPSIAEALELQAGRLQRLLGDYLLVSQPQGGADGPSGRQALALICELYGFASWEAFLKLSPRPQTDDLRAVPGRLGAAMHHDAALAELLLDLAHGHAQGPAPVAGVV